MQFAILCVMGITLIIKKKNYPDSHVEKRKNHEFRIRCFAGSPNVGNRTEIYSNLWHFMRTMLKISSCCSFASSKNYLRLIRWVEQQVAWLNEWIDAACTKKYFPVIYGYSIRLWRFDFLWFLILLCSGIHVFLPMF